MLTIGITDRRNIPHQDGEWIEIRKLSWKQLADARDARQSAVIGRVRAMGGDVIKGLPSRCSRGCGEEKHEGKCPPPEERGDPSAGDPTNEYDTGVLLHDGIAAWSYTEPCNAKHIDLLDEVTAEWAAKEIVAYNTKPLEEEQGN